MSFYPTTSINIALEVVGCALIGPHLILQKMGSIFYRIMYILVLASIREIISSYSRNDYPNAFFGSNTKNL